MTREADTFESFITREQERLTKEREDVNSQKAALDERLAGIEKEMRAIEAYVSAKEGRTAQPTQRRTRAGSRGRRGGKREAILDLIKKAADGLTRADLIEQMNGKGDKKIEQMVSNALSALKRTNVVNLKGGRYTAA